LLAGRSAAYHRAVTKQADDDPDKPAASQGSESKDSGEPTARPSVLGIELPSFPDDGPLSKGIRRIDNLVGLAEQAALFLLLGAVVITAASAALSDKVFGHHLGRWWFTVVRGGTFTIAMVGAVYATHQQRHLAMDLISRNLSPRGRLVLGVFLKLFTIAIAVILFRSGMHQRDHVGGGGVEEFVSDKTIVTMLPIGAALIIVHSILHILIDVEYLARRKLPPEKARTGH
jgi:TRAP-type C4-dicarboxylate transport system permease small subunit